MTASVVYSPEVATPLPSESSVLSVTAEPSSSMSAEPSASPSELESFGPVEVPGDHFKDPVLQVGLLTCAKKVDGSLRQVKPKDSCAADEWDLGDSPVVAGAKRPDALDPRLQVRFEAVQKAAKTSSNLDLEITSGWRSLSYQADLFANAIKKNGSRKEALKWVALPKVSMHPWGLAVDINYTPDGREEASWVEKHGAAFGLCRVYDNEWWHFEPVIAPGDRCPKRKPNANFAVPANEASATPSAP
jgi:hypothetical protein